MQTVGNVLDFVVAEIDLSRINFNECISLQSWMYVTNQSHFWSICNVM